MSKKGNVGIIVLISFVVILVVAFGFYQSGYNKAIMLDENVQAAWAQVDNQLQRRADLIPNLVNSVKGYASHEREVLSKVTELRSQWGKAQNVPEKMALGQQMSSALGRLMLVAERYPDLKANQNFLALQTQLEGTENRISVERRRYNTAVKSFNTFQRKLFGRFFAQAAGVTEPAEYFETDEAAATVPTVQF